MVIHIVRQGDTIYRLSRKYGISMQKIIDDNAILNTQELVIGQALVINVNNVKYTVKPGDALYSIART